MKIDKKYFSFLRPDNIFFGVRYLHFKPGPCRGTQIMDPCAFQPRYMSNSKCLQITSLKILIFFFELFIIFVQIFTFKSSLKFAIMTSRLLPSGGKVRRQCYNVLFSCIFIISWFIIFFYVKIWTKIIKISKKNIKISKQK